MDSEFVTASFETLLDQSTKTATQYLHDAHDAIDRLFGDGYAKTHPELVGAFMKTAAIDLAASTLAKVQGHSAKTIGYSLDSIADAIRNHQL